MEKLNAKLQRILLTRPPSNIVSLFVYLNNTTPPDENPTWRRIGNSYIWTVAMPLNKVVEVGGNANVISISYG